MTSEDMLYTALSSVMPTFHLAMDGEQAAAAVYREAPPGIIYESGEPIITTDRFDIEVYQKEHDPGNIESIIQALRAAGFFARISGAQTMVDYEAVGYSVDRLSASRTRGME